MLLLGHAESGFVTDTMGCCIELEAAKPPKFPSKGLRNQKNRASGGAAQAAEARRGTFSGPATWLGPSSEHDPQQKITKVLTYQKLKITKVTKVRGRAQNH